MTSQVLLPSDHLLSSLASLITEDNLPYQYIRRSGEALEQNRLSMRNPKLSESLSSISEQAIKCLKGVKHKRDVLIANKTVWVLAKRLILDQMRGKSLPRGDHKDIAQSASSSMMLTSLRLGKMVSITSNEALTSRFSGFIDIFCKLQSLASSLENYRDDYNREAAKLKALWKKNGKDGEIGIPDCYSERSNFRYYQVGPVVIVSVGIEDCDPKAFVMTNIHYGRLIDLCKGLSNLALGLATLNYVGTPERCFMNLINPFLTIGAAYPNSIGGIIKSSRQILFLKGDKSSLLGIPASDAYILGLDGEKLKLGPVFASTISFCVDNHRDAINLSNIFKLVLQPDTPMDELFHTMDGLRSPNFATPDSILRFSGVMRRAAYLSMKAAKHDVRVAAIDPLSDQALTFAQTVNQSSTKVSELARAGYTKWNSVKFLPVDNMRECVTGEISVSSKSSADKVKINSEEPIRNPRNLAEYRKMRSLLRNVNDAESRLAGTDNLAMMPAIERFKNTIKIHEEFESSYDDIDSIPSKDLSEFVLKNPEASYTVLTEPKLGEVHKEVTRMFYMAEQMLKVITQTSERLTRQVFGKHVGVSISKTFPARRRELEEMANAYTGLDSDPSQLGERNTFFISFDMSEFSKKFPMSLVREIGSVLSEVSGEDWLRRLDLVFRSSVVAHNTRGYMNAMSGVRGGFEGFLNFLWSSAMAVVMEIATESIGLQGILAAYSDDGLLRIYFRPGTVDVKHKLSVMRAEFAKYGLQFQYSKTAASCEVFEYLGVLVDTGMIISTWFKELCSFGKRKTSPGLDTIYDKIQLLNSQSSAICKAGGDLILSHFLSTYGAIRVLRRLNSSASPVTLSLLLIIPSSAGGFRIQSPTELSSVTCIESIMEFAADLEILQERFPAYTSAIATRISENLLSPPDSLNGLISASYLQTSLPDTSGMGLTRGLISKGNFQKGDTGDPITQLIKDSIISEIKSSYEVPVSIVKKLISSVPSVIEYQKKMALVKGHTALKFVSRRDIASAQRSDTRICMRSMDEWIRYLESYRGEHKNIRSNVFVDFIIRICYPGFSIMPMKESSRVALLPSIVNPEIVASVEYTADGLITGQRYKEPAMRFLGTQLSQEFSSERTSDDSQRSLRKFITTSARMLSTAPDLIKLYCIVASAFNLPCPAPLSMTALSAHRSTRNFGLIEAHVHLPSPYHALSSSRITQSFWEDIGETNRADRTTYCELAKLAASLEEIPNRSSSFTRSIHNYYYIVRDHDNNIFNREMKSRFHPPDNLIDQHTTRVFTSLAIEEEQQRRTTETMIHVQGLLSVSSDPVITRSLLLSMYTEWLYSSIVSHRVSPHVVSSGYLPDSLRIGIMLDAASSVAMKLCSAGSRASILREMGPVIRSYIRTGYDMESARGEIELSELCERKHESLYEYERNLSAIYEAYITSSNFDSADVLFSDYSVFNEHNLRAFIENCVRMSSTHPSEFPTCVVTSESFSDSKMSPKFRNAVKDAVYFSIQDYLGKLTSFSYETKSDIPTDDIHVNILCVIKSKLRLSGHRDHPFNQTMAGIEVMKLHCFMSDLIDDGKTSVTANDLSTYRLERSVVENALQSAVRLREESSQRQGSDYRRYLIDEGIELELLPRINYILRHRIVIPHLRHFSRRNRANDRYLFDHCCRSVDFTYDSTVRTQISNIRVYNTRVAGEVLKSTVQSPVEDASYISAEPGNRYPIGNIRPSSGVSDDNDSQQLIDNLILMHSTRWGVSGYTSETQLSFKLRRIGCFNHGGARLGVCRDNMAVFEPSTIPSSCDFYLLIMDHPDEDSAASNYLVINRTPTSMCVPVKVNDTYMTLSIIPAGTKIYNSPTPCKIRYVSGDRVLFRGAKSSLMTTTDILTSMSRRVSQRGNTVDFFSTRDGYNRTVGSGSYIENKDHTLVAISEMVRGAWSETAGDKVYILFLAWARDASGLKGSTMRAAKADFMRMKNSPENSDRVKLAKDISLVWQWVAMSNIMQGTDISSSKVTRIVDLMIMTAPRSGAPAAATTLQKESVSRVASMRGTTDRWGAPKFKCGNISDNLFCAPSPRMIEDDIEIREDEFNELDIAELSPVLSRRSSRSD